MKFNGYVEDYDERVVFLMMEPDDGNSREAWEVDRKKVPEAWLSKGAICAVEIGPEEGQVLWIFDCSYFTDMQMKKFND